MRASIKYRVIYRHKDKYSVSDMCSFFGVSRSGYYDFVKRMDIPSKDLPLAEKIRECHDKCGKTYGYRRVHIWLERNVMNRDFKTERPNHKWATDISYIRTGQGFLYLSVIRDLYDNSIVAYKTGTEQNIRLVLDTVREAVCKEKVTGELQLHSDQGFQYTSQAYFNLTTSYNITQSMSRRGNPYDNAMAENFFSILKTECIHSVKLQTFEEARNLIDEYIYFYNHERIQLKTKLTPFEKRCQYVA